MNTPYQTINIILADDHEIFRDGFRSLIREESSINLVAEAADGYTLLNLADQYKPDIILTDIKMPGLNGIEVTEELLKRYPHSAVIALTMFNEDHMIIDMLSAGAKGYLLKDASKKEIIDAIYTVNKNLPYYCPSTNIKLARLIATNTYDPIRKERKMPLSKRETEILKLLCNEKTNNEISKQLGISLRTVEGFRLKLLSKTKSANLAGLIFFAMRYGLVKREE